MLREGSRERGGGGVGPAVVANANGVVVGVVVVVCDGSIRRSRNKIGRYSKCLMYEGLVSHID